MTQPKHVETADLPAPIASAVRDFYLDASLDVERVDELLANRDLAASMIKWRRLAVASSVGLAAMTLIAISLLVGRARDDENSVASRPGGPRIEDGVAPPSTVGEETTPAMPITQNGETSPRPTAVVSGEPAYLLVAFRSHGEGCPFCRETGKAFRDIRTRLDSDLVQLEEIHLGDPASAQENAARIEEYNLSPLVATRTETAFLALTTRHGDVVERFKPTLGGEEIARRIHARVTN